MFGQKESNLFLFVSKYPFAKVCLCKVSLDLVLEWKFLNFSKTISIYIREQKLRVWIKQGIYEENSKVQKHKLK